MSEEKQLLPLLAAASDMVTLLAPVVTTGPT